MSPRPITITSYNMHKGMSALNRKVQVDSMAEELRGIGSDVLFLQEVQGQHLMRSNRLPDFPKQPHYDILGDRLSYNRSYGKNAVYPQRHHGNAILSRLPLETRHNLNISVNKLEQRGVLHCCPKVGTPRSSASAPTSTCANPTAPNNTAPSSNTSCITSIRKAR